MKHSQAGHGCDHIIIIRLLHNLSEASTDLLRYPLLGNQLITRELHPLVKLLMCRTTCNLGVGHQNFIHPSSSWGTRICSDNRTPGLKVLLRRCWQYTGGLLSCLYDCMGCISSGIYAWLQFVCTTTCYRRNGGFGHMHESCHWHHGCTLTFTQPVNVETSLPNVTCLL